MVDYGCGPGIFSIVAATIVGRQGKVFALDVRPEALEKLKEIAVRDDLPSLQTVLLDRSTVSVDLATGSADVIVVYDVLQEIPDKQGLIKELHRLLKADGVLSVFPMHLLTAKFLDLVDTSDLFQVRERQGVPGFQSASEVVNLTKRTHRS